MTNKRYGYYRYGRHEYEPPQQQVGEDRPTDELTPRDAFGSGVALASADDDDEIAWDFVVDSSGDLAATEGYDELGKDVAFSTSVESSDQLGMLGSANEIAQLEATIERLTKQDPRLSSARATVRSGGRSVEQRGVGDPLDPDPNLIEVDLEVDIRSDISRELTIPLRR